MLPVGIGPVRLPPALDRLAMDQLQQPHEIVVGQKGMRRVAGERVVEHLLIVRLGAAFKQKARQRASLGMQWPPAPRRGR